MVESSLQGRLLYERHGFVLKHHYALPVPDKFAGRPKERLFFMHRPRKMSGEETVGDHVDGSSAVP